MADLKERKLSGAKSSATTAAGGAGADEDGATKKKGKRKLIIIAAAVVLLAAVGGGAFWFLTMRAPAEEPPPEPGEVAAFGPISLNLAEGHYLKVGVAIQLAATAGGGGHGAKVVVDGSKALDLTIETFSGRTVAELADPAQRALLKEELLHDVEEAYHENHHVVMDLYFTEFVTQ